MQLRESWCRVFAMPFDLVWHAHVPFTELGPRQVNCSNEASFARRQVITPGPLTCDPTVPDSAPCHWPALRTRKLHVVAQPPETACSKPVSRRSAPLVAADLSDQDLSAANTGYPSIALTAQALLYYTLPSRPLCQLYIRHTWPA